MFDPKQIKENLQKLQWEKARLDENNVNIMKKVEQHLSEIPEDLLKFCDQKGLPVRELVNVDLQNVYKDEDQRKVFLSKLGEITKYIEETIKKAEVM